MDNFSKDKFISMLLNIVHTIQLSHFSAAGNRAYSEHTALGEAFDKLNPLIDDLVESLQGAELRLLELRIDAVIIPNNLKDYIQKSIEFVKKTRVVFENSWENSILDEIEKILNKINI